MLEERLDAGHEDPRAPVLPRGQRRDPGGGLVGDQLAALVGERSPRLEDGDGRRVAQPGAQLLRHAIGDLRVPGDPDKPLTDGPLGEGRREVCLRAVRHRDEADVTAAPRVVVDASQALAQARERAGRCKQRWQGGEVWEAVAAGLAAGASPRRRQPAGRACGDGVAAAAAALAARVLDLGVDRGDVEVDLGLGTAGRVGRRSRSRPFGDPAVAASAATQRRCRAWVRRPASAGRIRRQPVRVRRMPSASGRAVDLAGRGEPGRVGRPQLEHVEAVGRLARPLACPFLDRVRGGIEQLVESRLLVGREGREDVVDRRPIRFTDPDPQPAELLGPELVDDRAQAVVAARPPPSRKRSLPNGSAKSSATTRRSVSGARSRARTLRTASPESFM